MFLTNFWTEYFQINKFKPPGIAQVVEHRDLGRKVVGLNLPAVPEVTLGSHSSSSLTIPRCKFRTRPWPGHSEITMRIHYEQATENTGDGASTLSLALKPMGGVNWSKQRVPVAPQNTLSPQNIFFKNDTVRGMSRLLGNAMSALI